MAKRTNTFAIQENLWIKVNRVFPYASFIYWSCDLPTIVLIQVSTFYELVLLAETKTWQERISQLRMLTFAKNQFRLNNKRKKKEKEKNENTSRKSLSFIIEQGIDINCT